MKKFLIFLIFFNFNTFSLGKVLTPTEKQEYKAIKLQINNHINAIGQHKATNGYIFQYLKNIGTPIALRYIEDTIKIDFLLNEGINLLINKKYHEAIQKFDEAIYIDEETWFIFPYRALAYISLHNVNEALNDFSRAITLAQSFGFLYVCRAACYQLLGNNSRAVKGDMGIASKLGESIAQGITMDKKALHKSIEEKFGFKPGIINW